MPTKTKTKNSSLTAKLKKIKAFIFDVDGVLTDGKIYLSGDAEEIKCFNSKDAPRIAIALKSGLAVLFFTARRCAAIERRARELKAELIYKQDLKEKKILLLDAMRERYKINPDEIFYTGDDWSDLYCMQQVGVSATPADGSAENKAVADIITRSRGGEGIAAEVIEQVMRTQGIWERQVNHYKNELIY